MMIDRNLRRREKKSSRFPILMIVLLSASLLLLESCIKKAAGWQGTMRTENGVVIVENPAEPLYKNASITLTEELSIGGMGADGEAELLQVHGCDVDGAGNIYISDIKTNQIKAFDAMGRFICKIGSMGQGPGEFQMPMMIRVTDNNELAVMDGQGKIIFYSLSGHYSREIVNPNIVSALPLGMDKEAFIYGTLNVYDSTPKRNLVRFDPNSKTMGIVASVDNPDHFSKREIVSNQPYFVCAIDNENRLIWGYPEEYVLHIENSSGRRIKQIKRRAKAVVLTDKDKENDKKMFESMLKSYPDFHLVIKDAYPFFYQLSKDDDGRLIVCTFERSKDQKLFSDIFDSEGRYVAKVVIPFDLGRHHWKNGKLYGVVQDKEGYPVVKRYAVKWRFES